MTSKVLFSLIKGVKRLTKIQAWIVTKDISSNHKFLTFSAILRLLRNVSYVNYFIVKMLAKRPVITIFAPTVKTSTYIDGCSAILAKLGASDATLAYVLRAVRIRQKCRLIKHKE